MADVIERIGHYDKVLPIQLYRKNRDGSEEWSQLSQNEQNQLLQLAQAGRDDDYYARLGRAAAEKIDSFEDCCGDYDSLACRGAIRDGGCHWIKFCQLRQDFCRERSGNNANS